MSNRIADLRRKFVRYVGHRSALLPYPRQPDVSQGTEAALRPEEWAARAFVLLREALGVQRAALLTASRDKQGESCTLLVKLFQDVPAATWPTLISWPFKLCTHFSEAGTIALRREIERLAEFQAIPLREREWLRLLDMEVYISLGDERGLRVLAFGPKGSGAFYSRSELNLALMLVKRARSDDPFRESLRGSELARLGENLQRLEEAKSGFLTIASHELKTPLTLIRGYANMLSALSDEDLRSQERIAYITEGLIRGAGRLRQIIDDMTDVSRIDAQSLNLQWRRCSLAHVIGLAVIQIAPAAEERRQTIAVQPLDGLPGIEGDGQRLCQALRNVLENAIKYTPDGGQISVSAQLADSESATPQCVELVIKDQGIGIALENQDLIFGKFSRLGDADLHSSSRVQFKGGGPGLGLTITRGIIEAHGGKVWVESEGYDEKRCPGSQFHIRLPLMRAAQVS